MATDRTTMLFAETEPPQDLASLILRRIALAHRRAARLQFALYSTITFLSVVALVPAVQYAASEFAASGFYDYASLFFDGLARGYWREILYSLTASLPSLSLLILAAIGSAGIWSLVQIRQHAPIALTRSAVSL